MIRFEAMSKSFGRQAAVTGLQLEVRSGEVVALLGPNGSGKSTSLKAAAGLVRPTTGRALVGDPPRPAHEPSARRALSYLPQVVRFPGALTGREVIEFHRRLRGVAAERAGAVLEATALAAAASRPVGTYSGGMMQRLGLAVAALAEAPALLLDEPTASLDAEGLSAFYALVERQRAARRAVLFTSHSFGDVERLADRIAVMVAGRLVATLTRDEVADRLARDGARLDVLYRALTVGER